MTTELLYYMEGTRPKSSSTSMCKPPRNYGTLQYTGTFGVMGKTSMVACMHNTYQLGLTSAEQNRGQILSPWLEDKIDSGIGFPMEDKIDSGIGFPMVYRMCCTGSRLWSWLRVRLLSTTA